MGGPHLLVKEWLWFLETSSFLQWSMEQLEEILERLWVSLEIDAQPGFKENSEVGPGTLEVRVSRCRSWPGHAGLCHLVWRGWAAEGWADDGASVSFHVTRLWKPSKGPETSYFFCFEVEFPASCQTLTENLVSDHFFFRTRLRLWRSLSLTGSDAAQAGGFEIGRAPCDWQAVTALPPCLDFHYRRVEIHVCQRLVCTWVYRFTLSPIKVMTPWRAPFSTWEESGGRVTLRSIDHHWPFDLGAGSISFATRPRNIWFSTPSCLPGLTWLDILTKHCVCLAAWPCANSRKLQLIQGKTFRPQLVRCQQLKRWVSWMHRSIAVGRLIFVKSVDAAYRLKILPAPEYGKVKVSDFLVKKKCCKSPWRSCNGFLEGFQISIFGFSWHIKSRQIWEHVFKSYEFQT